jgi:uncharacterized membrane protein (UPF0127 family)
MKGLLDASVCDRGEILVLIACKSIHTFGMKESIDVAFIDRHGRVLEAIRGLPPRRFLACKKAACTLERRSMTHELWFEQGETIGLAV